VLCICFISGFSVCSKPVSNGEVNRTEVPDPYAQIVHCLIYRQDGLYGFAEPYYIHHTLKDLVLHYRETSLFEHNDELDTTLRIPVGSVDHQVTTSTTGTGPPVAQVNSLLIVIIASGEINVAEAASIVAPSIE